jgi:hypothetical protein
MAENLNLQLTVDTSGASTSVGSLKKQLREAQAEVTALAEKFGATSKEAINAAKRAAELKDAIGDAKALTEAFNPDAKFKALTASLSGVAGGFGAVQGAMALFGAESEDVQKTLLKVQSAMAISQGLQSVGESIDSFKQLGAVIKSTTAFQKLNETANKAAAFSLKLIGVAAETTSTSFKVMKGAIAATGIGVLVLALGEAISAFQSFQSSAEDAAAAQAELNKKAVEFADMDLDTATKSIARRQKVDIAEAKFKGKTAKEIYDIEESYRQQTRDALQRHWIEIGATNVEGRIKDEQDIKASLADSKAAKFEFDAAENKRIEDNNKQAAERAKQNNDRAKQLQKEKDNAELDAQDKINKLKTDIQISAITDEYEAKRTEIEAQLFNEIKQVNSNEKLKAETKKALIIELGNKANFDIAKIEKEQKDAKDKKDKEDLLKKQEEDRDIRVFGLRERIDLIDKERQKKDYDISKDAENLQLKKDLLNQSMLIELENLDLTELQKLEIKKKYADENEKINTDEVEKDKKNKADLLNAQKQFEDAKYSIATEGLNLIGQLAGQGTALAKAAALSQIVIDTGRGFASGLTIAQNSAKATGPAAAFAFPIFYATQIAAVLGAVGKAKSILSQVPGGGGAGGAVSAPSISTAAPMAPQAPTAQTTNISQQSINQMGNQAIKAYVVESDVTNNQQRIEAIRQRARFS